MDEETKKTGAKRGKFPYYEAPMVNAFPGAPADCFDLANQYGTYEIQRTADTENFFPAIAQGLAKGADFEIRTKNLEDMNDE